MDIVEAYLGEMEEAIRSISRAEVRAIVDLLEDAWRRGRAIFIVGNGGSASTASHMMNDLCKFTAVPGCKRVRAVALTDNVPLLTAYGNDHSYDDVFVEPLANLLSEGDVLIAISASGNSRNVLKCCEYALEHGASVAALCGRPGGKLATLATCAVVIPADRIGQHEDGHLIVNHVLALALRERIEAAAGAQAVSR